MRRCLAEVRAVRGAAADQSPLPIRPAVPAQCRAITMANDGQQRNTHWLDPRGPLLLMWRGCQPLRAGRGHPPPADASGLHDSRVYGGPGQDSRALYTYGPNLRVASYVVAKPFILSALRADGSSVSGHWTLPY